MSSTTHPIPPPLPLDRFIPDNDVEKDKRPHLHVAEQSQRPLQKQVSWGPNLTQVEKSTTRPGFVANNISRLALSSGNRHLSTQASSSVVRPTFSKSSQALPLHSLQAKTPFDEAWDAQREKLKKQNNSFVRDAETQKMIDLRIREQDLKHKGPVEKQPVGSAPSLFLPINVHPIPPSPSRLLPASRQEIESESDDLIESKDEDDEKQKDEEKSNECEGVISLQIQKDQGDAQKENNVDTTTALLKRKRQENEDAEETNVEEGEEQDGKVVEEGEEQEEKVAKDGKQAIPLKKARKDPNIRYPCKFCNQLCSAPRFLTAHLNGPKNQKCKKYYDDHKITENEYKSIYFKVVDRKDEQDDGEDAKQEEDKDEKDEEEKVEKKVEEKQSKNQISLEDAQLALQSSFEDIKRINVQLAELDAQLKEATKRHGQAKMRLLYPEQQ